MNINKSLKKQKGAYKRFLLFMCFIFILLPLFLFWVGNYKLYLIIFLCILEILIIATIIIKVDSEELKFQQDKYKIKIKTSIFNKEFILNQEKVALVHANDENDFIIIIICTSNFRNKSIKPINKDFMIKYGEVSEEYTRIKKLNPEEQYYYFIIKNGGLRKYFFLDFLYRNCVRAFYTESTIEKIKYFRENNHSNHNIKHP